MKIQMIAVIASAILSSTAVFANGTSEWGYTGQISPQHWSELDAKNVLCGISKNQSPIDLTNFVEAKLGGLQFDYKTFGNQIVNNGHSVQIDYQPGSTLTINNRNYELKQFHFHTPSENRINGKSFPLEAHFVHADKDGNLAVLAVMYEEGTENPIIDQLWRKMPEHAGDKQAIAEKVSALELLPTSKDYYEFSGSLTTPPCTEGVLWLVLKQPLTVSKQQVEKFAKVMQHPNNRPIQMVGARAVLNNQ